MRKTATGYDEKATLDDLIEKYGVEDEPKPTAAPVISASPVKTKRKANTTAKDEGNDGVGSPAVKKVKKTDIVACEENRPAAEAIKEMADIYFRNKDMRKGGILQLSLCLFLQESFLTVFLS